MPVTGKPRKHGKRWRISYYDAAGTRRWESFATFKAAEKALRQRKVEEDRRAVGQLAGVDREKTFDDLVERWEVVKAGKRSLRDDQSRIARHLRPAFGGVAVYQITAGLIADFAADLRKKKRPRTDRAISTSTVGKVLGLLRAMLRVAHDEGWIAVVPKVRVPREPKRDYQWIRTSAELEAFLEAARVRGAEYPGLFELYATAAYTGMRQGELAGLRWERVDFANRLITVAASYGEATKTDDIRYVPIFDVLLPVLKGWREQRAHDELVFVNQWGNMLSNGSKAFRVIFHETLAAAGVSRIRFHDLRHTFASRWMLRGGDLFKLQKILGHKSMAMTLRYAHLAPKAFAGDLGRFG